MSFIQHLQESSPVAHDLLVFSIVVLAGIGLGNIRVAGVRMGVAGVLFTGLMASHFGLRPEAGVAHFLKDFGLVLFVFALGMQMGPGFFASLRRQGHVLNGYAFALVLGGAFVALLGGWLLDIPLPAVAGLFAGATTNTPALGAVQQALQSAHADPATVTLPALSYAAAYPLAIVGIIVSLILLRGVFKIDVVAEAEAFRGEQGAGVEPLQRMNLRVENPNLDGVAIADVPGILETGVVIARHRPASAEDVRTAMPETRLHTGDLIMAVGTQPHLEQFRLVIGSVSEENLMKAPGSVTYRRVVLTNKRILGKTVRELGLDHLHNVTVTRVSRGDLIFTALPDLRLQFGDMLQLVGDEESLNGATKALGNAVQMLQETKFAAIFAGILLGVLLGLYPLHIEGLPAPVKLGLAGGPLVMAILLSHLGRLGPMIMHMPLNANRALRELGIILFLANVGLLSGEKFVETVVSTQGLQWVLLGIAVTMLPLLAVGWLARRWHRMNFMSVCGLLSGGMTDPPALAFATTMARCDSPAVAYATVYPLTMLLRIVVAQIIAQLG
ncbi:MAG: putative transporter [Prosthecobacter sp.]|jgi:putative transport protein|uniref:putative transporter n=1 Tax=Prosthecobacter sp. TaxID=1965333 RepID=UPI0019F21566|nr:putative transporter [Prosthecobacter sp.]MBE2287311.1 putative transporter [Prosthecobacter sp.]